MQLDHFQDRNLVGELIGVGLFTAAYSVAAIVAAWMSGNTEFILYIAVMGVLSAAIIAVHVRVRLTAGLLWALAFWGALHMAGGLVPVPHTWAIDGEYRVLYSWWIIPGAAGSTAGTGTGGWLKYDQVVHAYGFAITTLLCWQALCGAVRGWAGDGRTLRPTPGLMVLVAAAGIGFGALNEVIEFLATRMTETNVGGYVNTGWDLIYNLLGAVCAATTIHLAHRVRLHPRRSICGLLAPHDETDGLSAAAEPYTPGRA